MTPICNYISGMLILQREEQQLEAFNLHLNLSVKWMLTLLTTITYGVCKRIYLFSWLVGIVICESLLVF